ncbi:NAD-dependent protein deacetylase hst4 [Leucoagaricus sp. SymC.cos]|nr:NAD-dependent protein deacetylase hst4 [Leucoagaricus sp. SymC.cos]
MTIFLLLEADSPHPSKPSFLVQSSDVTMQLQKVIQSILMARRIVVVCGAGISVSAGVSDFCLPEGIFQLLRHGHPMGGLVSGKDLFYASVFSVVRSQTSCRSEGWQSSCSDPAPEVPMKVLYLNLDFSMPMRKWQKVFDIWVQGNIQQFAWLLQDEIDQQAKANQLFVPRKRKQEAEHKLAL